MTTDWATGKTMKVAHPGYDTAQRFGPHEIDPPLDMEEYNKRIYRLYALMTALEPVARDPGQGVPVGLKPHAEEFAGLWRHLSHRPVAAYYREIRPEWFGALGIGDK